MVVIDVIPLTTGIPAGTLSYRHQTALLVGSLVTVPLRKKKTLALITACSPLAESKAQLKRAAFVLRGGALPVTGALPESVLAAARRVATSHATTLGAVLGAFYTETISHELPVLTQGRGFKKQLIEDTHENRLRAYTKAIDEAAQQRETVVCIVPTVVEATLYARTYAAYNPLVLTGNVSGKKREALIAKAATGQTLIITTPSFAMLPVARIGTYILERAGAGSYTGQRRPYLDMRIAVIEMAHARKTRLLIGDFPLPFTLRAKPDAPLRAKDHKHVEIIDAKTALKDTRTFRALPLHALQKIEESRAHGKRIAVLASRKGYAPSVVCRDCGNLVKDEYGRVLSFVKTGHKPILRSADGKTVRDAKALCSVCGSWNLMPLGIGVDRVAEELAESFPDATLVTFEPERIRSPRLLAQKLALARAPGAILVGTESMLPYLDPGEPLSLGVIASSDTLLGLPFWPARERLVRIGLALRDRSEAVLIVTRHAEESALQAIVHPQSAPFWREEAALREKFSYPPYGHLLVFHAEGTKERVQATATVIEKTLGALPVTRLPDRAVSTVRTRLSMVAKISRDEWPNEPLARALSMLPASVTLGIDAESFW